MTTPPASQSRVAERLAAIDNDILESDYPIELVHAELREAGIDPEDVGKRGAEFVRGLLAEQRALRSWNAPSPKIDRR